MSKVETGVGGREGGRKKATGKVQFKRKQSRSNQIKSKTEIKIGNFHSLIPSSIFTTKTSLWIKMIAHPK